ncbi:hypothetical protein QCB45_04685 [Thiomicrorhabdus sp. ZW0627]|uniref:hypothetical protein n=1 Tax=Thiomicrorhabdus sp. ZW0627 TaxID=3039774 RepID=UPI0024368029|nr:hypothetical protein [Thiomicrorhabdus sp. ZW0627]MDG6773618.1 hypothetical protein [Thiomicrorhabdus sp. ZW0627]
MKVLMLTGSVPPEVCGVGDYTMNLSSSLMARGCEVDVVKFDFFSFFKVLKNRKKSIVHIQYPSIGYGMSLLPQLMAVLSRPVVTIHEFSQVHILRKLAELPLLFFAKKIIVTTEHEKLSISKVWSRFGRKIIVIPVLPAFMPKEDVIEEAEREGIAFFGLMRKEKGVEEFIELSRKLNQNFRSFPINIYSAIPKGSEDYFDEIKSISGDLDINWHLNKPLDEVSEGLIHSKYSYLFFPDGVSERRSSFIAALGHGVLMLSNSGEMTSSNLREAFIDVQSPEAALGELVSLEADSNRYIELRRRGLKAFEFYSPINIADMHVDIYKDFLGEK